MSTGLEALQRLRREAQEGCERVLAQRLAALHAAAEDLGRARERLAAHLRRLEVAGDSRCEAARTSPLAAQAGLRHEGRLRTEAAALRFGEVLGAREVERRAESRDRAVRAVEAARARLGVVESLLAHRARTARQRRARREDAAADDYSSSRNSSL